MEHITHKRKLNAGQEAEIQRLETAKHNTENAKLEVLEVTYRLGEAEALAKRARRRVASRL